MGEEDDIAGGGEGAIDDDAGAGGDVVKRFAVGDAVGEERPAGVVALNVGSAAAFVVAIVPFQKIGFDLSVTAESGEFASAAGALEGAGEDEFEIVAGESGAESGGFAFAFGRERQVGAAGVCAGEGPGGFAMADQPELGRHAVTIIGDATAAGC